MKKRMILGMVVLTCAFASAFALKSGSLAENPAYIDSSGNCQTAGVTCNGNVDPCSKDVGGGIGTKEIFQFNTVTDCSPRLLMN